MTTTDELRKYELMLIFSSQMPESDFEKELNELRKFLQENTKGISHEDSWGLKDFTYRLRKQSRGYYVILTFTANPQQIMEFRTNIKLNPHVLRHLLITVPEDYEPGKYKEEIFISRGEPREEKRPPLKPIVKETIKETPKEEQPKVAGPQEEEQLKTVEKKLEKILENPDIEIR